MQAPGGDPVTGYLIDRPAALARCSRCGAATITAVTGGLTTVTDTKPLGIDQEISAILAGKATFSLQVMGSKIFLAPRSVAEIRAGRDHPVVALHSCPAGIRQLPVPAAAASSVSDDPPF